jgi:hypothetical protein
MKREIRSMYFETTESVFSVTISELDDGTLTGEYHGTTPKFAGLVKPGAAPRMMQDVGEGKVTGTNVEDVIARCREEIEKLDGPIVER